MTLRPREPQEIKRLTDVGFERVGEWCLVEPSGHGNRKRWSGGIAAIDLRYDWGKTFPYTNAVYAFASKVYPFLDERVLYIGKTNRGLKRRFTAYESPGGGCCDSRICGEIKRLLEDHRQVWIYGWADKDKSRIGEFEVDRYVSFEESLIWALAPPWNTPNRKPWE